MFIAYCSNDTAVYSSHCQYQYLYVTSVRTGNSCYVFHDLYSLYFSGHLVGCINFLCFI